MPRKQTNIKNRSDNILHTMKNRKRERPTRCHEKKTYIKESGNIRKQIKKGTSIEMPQKQTNIEKQI